MQCPQGVCLLHQQLGVLVVHSGEKTLISRGSLWRKRQAKRLVFSSPLGHISSMAAIISDGFLSPIGGERYSFSAR
jgi:homogentisate 1,2-dioxygenase